MINKVLLVASILPLIQALDLYKVYDYYNKREQSLRGECVQMEDELMASHDTSRFLNFQSGNAKPLSHSSVPATVDAFLSNICVMELQIGEISMISYYI